MSFWKMAACAALAVGTAMAANQARAAGTPANTIVTNTATVNYQVGGVAQPPVQGTTTFVVDRKIIVTVAEAGGTATGPVVPGQQNVATTFTVTNNSNAPLDFSLSGANRSGSATAHGGTDNQDMENIRVFVEGNGTPGYQFGGDTGIFIDELAADASATVYVVANAPASASNGQVATVTLKATAREANQGTGLGDAIAETAGADTPGAMDTVFADTQGVAGVDGARDAAHSDDDDYLISLTPLTLTKATRVISDGFNSAADAKAIPGAVVEYCLILFNGSATAATDVALSDVLPGSIAYNAGTIFSQPTVTGGASCLTEDGTAEDDNATDSDDADGFGVSYDAGSRTVAAIIGSIAANERKAIRYRATIQ